MSTPVLSPAQLKDEDFEGFEDDPLVLSKLSENLTLDSLSLKSFRCREEILLEENTSGDTTARRLSWEHPYRVLRQPRKRVVSEATFTETRDWQVSAGEATSGPPQDFPLFDAPFTGYVSQMFTFDNRLSSDFKKGEDESNTRARLPGSSF